MIIPNNLICNSNYFFLFSFSLSLFLLLLLSALCSSWSRVACAAATLETRLGDKVSLSGWRLVVAKGKMHSQMFCRRQQVSERDPRHVCLFNCAQIRRQAKRLTGLRLRQGYTGHSAQATRTRIRCLLYLCHLTICFLGRAYLDKSLKPQSTSLSISDSRSSSAQHVADLPQLCAACCKLNSVLCLSLSCFVCLAACLSSDCICISGLDS